MLKFLKSLTLFFVRIIKSASTYSKENNICSFIYKTALHYPKKGRFFIAIDYNSQQLYDTSLTHRSEKFFQPRIQFSVTILLLNATVVAFIQGGREV